jgi:nitric oxide reductase large subunit
MEDKPKIDLQRHVVKRVSRKYLWKILFYILLLAAMAIVYYNQKSGEEVKKQPEIKEIHNVTVEE